MMIDSSTIYVEIIINHHAAAAYRIDDDGGRLIVPDL
jgi:hypothetical protein